MEATHCCQLRHFMFDLFPEMRITLTFVARPFDIGTFGSGLLIWCSPMAILNISRHTVSSGARIPRWPAAYCSTGRITEVTVCELRLPLAKG